MRVSSLLLLLLFSAGACAQSAQLQLNQFTQGLNTASAPFQQAVTGPNGEKVQILQGRLWMKTPNRFHWQYQKPLQTIVADGRKVWIYEPDLKQVTVKTQDALNQDNPLSALTQPSLLPRFYTVSELPAQQGMAWLQLVPKNKQASPFEKAWLGFNNNGLRTMRLFDNLGQVSEFNFGTWQRNPVLPASRFEFRVPKNVDIVE
jgi:outer membrane lipoprotein carrier protein